MIGIIVQVVTWTCERCTAAGQTGNECRICDKGKRPSWVPDDD